MQYYQDSADKGNVDAQTAVGQVLNYGTHGVQRDHAAAMRYLKRAADAGDVVAMAQLGHMHANGMVRGAVVFVHCANVQLWVEIRGCWGVEGSHEAFALRAVVLWRPALSAVLCFVMYCSCCFMEWHDLKALEAPLVLSFHQSCRLEPS